jgi:protein-S-isoprenylcysteine O-methyltransferase Ste14
VLLLAGGSLVLLRGAYSANRGILDQPGDRSMARRLATCGSFQCSQNPMSLGAMVLSPGLGLFLLSPSILWFAALLFYFCFVTSWLYLWKSRSSEMVSGKPIASLRMAGPMV